MLTAAISNPTLRPPLKWAGGKRWQVSHIKPLWLPHSHRRFVEPFCGGLAMVLGLMPECALLNDINPHLINFYTRLQKGFKTSIAMSNDRTLFYQHREQFNQLLGDGRENSAKAAALFYYLNRTGFNGLCRFNQKGGFNVPFGRYKKISYTRDFAAYSPAFSKWTFSCGNFESVPVRRGDFIYADPPYDVEFTQYSKEVFGWEEQVRVAEWLARHRGPVVLVNQATKRIKQLYKSLGFQLTTLAAPRRISCNGNRTPAREVLAVKNI